MDSNEQLVDYLVRSNRTESGRVEEAFRKVDRGDFVPKRLGDKAYIDRALPLEPGATISAPHMVAVNTELLDVISDSRVLEIGSGSGYQAAILSELGDEVVGVEVKKDLAESSRERTGGNVEIRHGNGFDVIHRDEVFDRILFSCAVGSVDEAREYLGENGVIVAPVKRDGHQVLKRFNDKVTEHGRVRFVEFLE